MKALILEQLSAYGLVSFPTNDAVSRHHLVFELSKLPGDSKLLGSVVKFISLINHICLTYAMSIPQLKNSEDILLLYLRLERQTIVDFQCVGANALMI